MRLNPGDCVYYEPHRALGMLLETYEEQGVIYWRYALRSPPRSDLTNVRISIQAGKESDFIESIKDGRFSYYGSG